MKIIIFTLLLFCLNINFSQTKIFELPKAKEPVWIKRPNGNVVIYSKKAENVIEISPKGDVLNEYKYDHVISKMMYRSPSFVSSPDNMHLIVINPLFDVNYDYIISTLKNGKAVELLNTSSDKQFKGNIIDIFCDNDFIYIQSSEKVDKTIYYSLYAINQTSHKKTMLAKNYFEKSSLDMHRALEGRILGQNENSIFINFTNKLHKQELPNSAHVIYEIDKSDGNTKRHEIVIETQGLFPLHFDNRDKLTMDNLIRIKRPTYSISEGSGYTYGYYSPSEISQITINNDTINIIGILAEISSNKKEIALKQFYSIKYSTKSNKQTFTTSKLNNYKIETAMVPNLASPNKCFTIEHFGEMIYFERFAQGGLSGKQYTTTLLSGEFKDNKLSKVKFTESSGKIQNLKRLEALGINTSKFDLNEIDMGSQVNPTVFSVIDKKTLFIYTIK